MKTNEIKNVKTKSISAKTFIAFCELVGHDPDNAVKSLKSTAWPDFREVSKLAQEMAERLEPSDENLPMHAWLFDLAMWCDRRVS